MASRAGEWFFPDNGGVVPVIGAGGSMGTTFYRTRGDDGTVNLNRVNNDVMMPTGRFCCVVPDAILPEVTMCANIGAHSAIQVVLNSSCILIQFLTYFRLLLWQHKVNFYSITYFEAKRLILITMITLTITEHGEVVQ